MCHEEENEGKEMDSLYILNTGEGSAIFHDKLAHSSGSFSLSERRSKNKMLPAFLLNQLQIHTASHRITLISS